MNKLITATLMAATVLTGVARANAASDCEVSLAQYKRLQNGMNYSAVVSLLGCEGEEFASTGEGKFQTDGYAWDGKGSLGANVMVMFQGGKLMMRAQFGLK
jgi:hypothetical protein